MAAQYELRDYKSYQDKQAGHAKERETWTFKNFMKKDPAALKRMKAENPNLFSQLFKNQYGVYPKL